MTREESATLPPLGAALASCDGVDAQLLARQRVGDFSGRWNLQASRIHAGGEVLLDQDAGVLRPEETLVEGYRRINSGATVNDAHAALARFLFRNTAAQRTARTLSGGERLRAALACVMSGARPPQRADIARAHRPASDLRAAIGDSAQCPSDPYRSCTGWSC